MATTITIENTEARIYSICDAPLKPGTERPDVLMPGLNEVDAAAWAKVRVVPAVAGLIESGALREVAVTPGTPADQLPPAPALTDMSAKDAIALVQSVTEKATLEAWYADEQRTTVLAAIEAQLATLGG